MQENDLFDIFPEFSKVVHILALIPATLRCSLFTSVSVKVVDIYSPLHGSANIHHYSPPLR